MYCKYCGTELTENTLFCTECGRATEIDLVQNTFRTNEKEPEKIGLSIVALILGICALFAWIIPLFGFPVTITGLVLGIIGIRRGGKGMAIAGIVLCSITLALTLINSVIGAYLGSQGKLGFQQENQAAPSENHSLEFVTDYGTDEEKVILTKENISSAYAARTEDTPATDYIVYITFDDEGAKIFADITKNHIGETITILYDDKVISAPIINNAITGGEAVINGLSSMEEAEEIAEMINTPNN